MSDARDASSHENTHEVEGEAEEAKHREEDELEKNVQEDPEKKAVEEQRDALIAESGTKKQVDEHSDALIVDSTVPAESETKKEVEEQSYAPTDSAVLAESGFERAAWDDYDSDHSEVGSVTGAEVTSSIAKSPVPEDPPVNG